MVEREIGTDRSNTNIVFRDTRDDYREHHVVAT